MSEIIGKQLEIGVTVEQTRGTAQASVEKWFKKMTASIMERSETKIDESSHNVLAEGDNRRVKKMDRGRY